jgi:hypothetical protein
MNDFATKYFDWFLTTVIGIVFCVLLFTIKSCSSESWKMDQEYKIKCLERGGQIVTSGTSTHCIVK